MNVAACVCVRLCVFVCVCGYLLKFVKKKNQPL